MVKSPTRITPSSSTCIDLLFSSIPEAHVVTDVIPLFISDNYMVFTVLNFKVIKQPPKIVKLRNYANFDSQAFYRDIQHSDRLNSIFIINDTNFAWSIFYNEFMKILNKHAPLRVHRVRARLNPWFSKKILTLMYKRDFLHNKALKSKCHHDWENYKEARNVVTDQIRLAKRSFIQDEIQKQSCTSKGIWNSLKYILPNKTVRSSTHCSSELNSEDFNSFFTAVGHKLTSHFNKDTLPDISAPSVFNDRFKFSSINPLFIFKGLKALPETNSVDILGFDNKSLKLSANCIYQHLAHIFMLSLTNGIVPRDWKRACVTPIYKGHGSKDNPSNFRPISITTTISKLLEAAVKEQLMEYVKNASLITNNQSAYLRGRSTQTALHTITNDLASGINDNLVNVLCSLDMAKGFDTVSHKILLHKLEHYGFSTISIKWFESYLTNRSQVVKYNGIVSSESPVSIGVKQGSVLGPILFLIYVNDFPSIFDDCHCEMFADDTTLVCRAKSLERAKYILQNNLSLAEEWLFNNQLVVNAKKSSVMAISNKVIGKHDLIVTLNNTTVPVLNEIKLLGLYIDEKMDFKFHIENMCKKISQKVGFSRRISGLLTSDQLCHVYQGIVQPHFDYIITIWGSGFNTYICKLQHLQNRCARIVSKNFNFNIPSMDIVNSLGWMTISKRYKYFIGILMFKCYHSVLSPNLSGSFTLVHELHSHNTRNAISNNFVLPAPRTNGFKRCLLYIGPKIWNNIPTSIKECDSILSFKNMYKRHLLD